MFTFGKRKGWKSVDNTVQRIISFLREIFRNGDRVPGDSRWRFPAGRFTVVLTPILPVRCSFGDQFLRSLLAPTISDNIIIRQGKFSSKSRGRFNLPMREAINAGSASAAESGARLRLANICQSAEIRPTKLFVAPLFDRYTSVTRYCLH